MLAVVGHAHRVHLAPAKRGGASATVEHERPARVDRLYAALRDVGSAVTDPDDHGLEPILAVHDRRLVAHLRSAGAAGRRDGEAVIPDVFPHVAMTPRAVPERVVEGRGLAGSLCFDCSSPLYRGSWKAIYMSAQIALTAADRVGETRVCYALCRPPGHHAGPSLYGGFCYLNNTAIAATSLLHRGRVAILDLDIHHGNGTQAAFWASEQVLTVSLHEHPSYGYPYFTGHPEERGADRGEGLNLNLPLAQGCGPDAYLDALEIALEEIADFAPASLVVALGFDGLAEDPLSDARLTPETYGQIAGLVAQLARPTVLVQEGGYALGRLQEAAGAFFGPFSGSHVPTTVRGGR